MFLSKYKKLITRALAIDTSRPVSKNKGVMSADQSAQSAPRAIIGALGLVSFLYVTVSFSFTSSIKPF